jgi:hypothetical protein
MLGRLLSDLLVPLTFTDQERAKRRPEPARGRRPIPASLSLPAASAIVMKGPALSSVC